MKKYWWAFAAVIVLSFSVLGWQGMEIYHNAPPIPKEIVTTDGSPVVSGEEIAAGQNVWQSIGGMEVGSFWGHGSYVAPDWTADWLHRELAFILDAWAQKDFGKDFASAAPEDQARLLSRLKKTVRTNTYDPSTGRIVVDRTVKDAFESNAAYYADVFSKGRSAYAIPQGALTDPVKLRQLASFIFWGSWVCSTNRPGAEFTYTSNWPHEDWIDNRPTGGLIVWTGVSIIMLLGGIGAMVWVYGSGYGGGPANPVPKDDPFRAWKPTPSQNAVIYYFVTAALLMLVQVMMGVITAHYGVEGNGFYGIPLSKWIPYSVTRTWHLQIGLFWIATAWLATGLFIAPVIAGKDAKGQAFLVWTLLAALVGIVVGSLAGQWLSIFQKFGGDNWFYWGHQGYEYLDLGRIWQWLLFGGLLLWLFMVVRSVWPILRSPGDNKSLLGLFTVSLVAISLFYGAGFFYGEHSSVTVAEYWRWWVVHLWVEGFFEVFATVSIAFLFAKMGLVQTERAAKAALFTSTVYLSGGIIGTLHHLYFAGTPVSALALGAVFSALEVVPLVLVGFEAWENVHRARDLRWVGQYKWPIYFFVAVAFWNMVGAGLFGFMINPPIALYYMQGLNTTAVHGHAALFGVYGMLGIGLMLFCLRVHRPHEIWKDGPIRFAFWAMNIGLFSMCVFSLLPVGLLQTWASVEHGYWYARSAEFLQGSPIQFLRWMRIPGDTIFAAGAVVFVFFLLRTVFGKKAGKTGS
ncbi:MAG TPA: nitric-oxide reductase large subunit [Candidatus Eisenbacteria bacterium]|jgi:nitric oxide reductase subunit B|nr:nitric-oxide reductase large subunit [Candidatus Eisenbacteria bacterium]